MQFDRAEKQVICLKSKQLHRKCISWKVKEKKNTCLKLLFTNLGLYQSVLDQEGRTTMSFVSEGLWELDFTQ